MLILASKSAARNALLAGAGLRFETSPAQIDERAVEAEVLGKGGDAVSVARRLAEAKALSVAENRAGAMVIGADQVLAVGSSHAQRGRGTAEGGGGGDHGHGFPWSDATSSLPPPPPPASLVPLPRSTGEDHGGAGGRILHKPASMDEAANQLDALKGRTHYLHSGVALARGEKILWSGVETAALTMRGFSEAERDRVLRLEGEAVLGSVGAYRLEGPGVNLFARIEGDYFTILGLPLLPLLAALREHAPHLME